MDTVSYVLSGVGLVLLLGLGYLYHVYTMAVRDLDDANRRVAKLVSDVAAADAIIVAKTDTITRMSAASLKQYHADAKKLEERLAKSDTSAIIGEFSSLTPDDVD